MEVSYKVADGLLRIKQVGTFDVDDYLRAIADVLKDGAFGADCNVVSDVTGVAGPPTATDMLRLRDGLNTGTLRAFRPRRYAIVTRAPMYEMIVKLESALIVDGLEELVDGCEMRRFASFEMAEAWARSKG